MNNKIKMVWVRCVNVKAGVRHKQKTKAQQLETQRCKLVTKREKNVKK